MSFPHHKTKKILYVANSFSYYKLRMHFNSNVNCYQVVPMWMWQSNDLCDLNTIVYRHGPGTLVLAKAENLENTSWNLMFFHRSSKKVEGMAALLLRPVLRTQHFHFSFPEGDRCIHTRFPAFRNDHHFPELRWCGSDLKTDVQVVVHRKKRSIYKNKETFVTAAMNPSIQHCKPAAYAFDHALCYHKK